MSRTLVIAVVLTVSVISHVLTCDAEILSLTGSEQLHYDVPEGWQHERMGDAVTLLTPGIDLKFAVLLMRESESIATQEAAETLLEEVAQPYAEGSVEKATKTVAIPGRIGCYASFTDASLVDKPVAPGNYKYVTQGIIGHGRSIFLFTLLSNDLSDAPYNQGLEVATTVSVQAPAAGHTTLAVPGTMTTLTLPIPLPDRVQSGPTESGYLYRAATKEGVSLSVFVERPANDAIGHVACADYYWEKASQNPLIDASTIAKESKERFQLISYRIREEKDAVKFDVPNLNLYINLDTRWVDIHLSKFPFQAADQPIFDAFVRDFSYADTPTSDTQAP